VKRSLDTGVQATSDNTFIQQEGSTVINHEYNGERI